MTTKWVPVTAEVSEQTSVKWNSVSLVAYEGFAAQLHVSMRLHFLGCKCGVMEKEKSVFFHVHMIFFLFHTLQLHSCWRPVDISFKRNASRSVCWLLVLCDSSDLLVGNLFWRGTNQPHNHMYNMSAAKEHEAATRVNFWYTCLSWYLLLLLIFPMRWSDAVVCLSAAWRQDLVVKGRSQYELTRIVWTRFHCLCWQFICKESKVSCTRPVFNPELSLFFKISHSKMSF